MYLIQGRKLLDALVFNGQQEIGKPIVTLQTLLFRGFLRFLFLFTLSLLYIIGIKKHIYCSTSFCRKKKNTANLTEKKRSRL